MVFRFHFLKLILLFNDLSFENTNNGVGCNKYLCKAEEIYERQYVFGRKLKLCSTENENMLYKLPKNYRTKIKVGYVCNLMI